MCWYNVADSRNSAVERRWSAAGRVEMKPCGQVVVILTATCGSNGRRRRRKLLRCVQVVTASPTYSAPPACGRGCHGAAAAAPQASGAAPLLHPAVVVQPAREVRTDAVLLQQHASHDDHCDVAWQHQQLSHAGVAIHVQPGVCRGETANRRAGARQHTSSTMHPVRRASMRDCCASMRASASASR